MKRFSSNLAVLLGLLGLILSIALTVAPWVFSGRINSVVVGLIVPVDTALSAVDERLLSSQGRVQALQGSTLATALETLTTLKESRPEIEIDTTPLIEDLEGKLEPALTALSIELSGLEPQITTIIQLLSIGKTLLPQEVQTLIEVSIAERVASMTANLAAMRTKLHDLKAELSSITVTTDIKRLEALDVALHELDAQLITVDATLQDLGTITSSIQDALLKLTRRMRFYLVLASLVISLLALWSGWAQLALLKNGRRSLRTR